MSAPHCINHRCDRGEKGAAKERGAAKGNDWCDRKEDRAAQERDGSGADKGKALGKEASYHAGENDSRATNKEKEVVQKK